MSAEFEIQNGKLVKYGGDGAEAVIPDGPTACASSRSCFANRKNGGHSQ